MKLPRATAVTPPPRSAGLARADVGAQAPRIPDTGELQALAQLGGAIGDVGEMGVQAFKDRQALDDQQKLGEIGVKSQEAQSQGVNEIGLIDMKESRPLPDNPDYYKGDKIPDSATWAKSNEDVYSRYKKKITDLSLAIKNPKTRQEWIAQQLISGGRNFGRVSRAKYNEYQETTILEYARTAARNGDIETANQWVDIAEKHGLIGAKKAVEAREDNIKEQIVGLYRTGNYDEARKVLEASSLSSTDKEKMDDEIDTDENAMEVQNKLAIKQKDDLIGNEFLDLLTNKLEPAKPQLTFDMINASELSFDAKSNWFTKLRTFDNYSENELKEAFIDKGEVLADIYDKIDDGTLTDELDTMVGKGLSPVTAQRIKGEIRKPFEKDTEQLFKRIFGWSPELGFKDDFASFLYEKSLREWQAEIKEQDATGEKIVEIGRSVVRPYFLEHLQKAMPSDEDITRMVELALGEETQKLDTPKPIESEIPKREPSEPEDYPSFRAEVSRLKGIDRVKAKEYYDAWIGKFRKE
jgi:hypothetical protein